MIPKLLRSQHSYPKTLAIGVSLVFLAGCENFSNGSQSATGDNSQSARSANGTLTLEERDVEAPEIFNVIDEALWDGRPSFGGVWVAYPGNTQPERVNIRNVGNGKSVVGALFKREADNPGPKITLSSDAAEQLGVLAGTPTKLTITALRREPIEVRTPVEEVEAPEVLSETVLAPVGETAAVATDGADAVALSVEDALKEVEAEAKPAPETAKEAQPVAAAAPTSTANQPAKPYIQVGTFSSQANANDLVAKLKAADVPATARSSTANNGKTLYKVVAGPAASAEQLTLFSTRIRDLGFKDAFPVSK